MNKSTETKVSTEEKVTKEVINDELTNIVTNNEMPILKGRKDDTFFVDPRLIIVEEGFNGRQVFDRVELDKLKVSIKDGGVRTPILAKKVFGKDEWALKNGERRVRACMELIAEGHEVLIPVRRFTGNDVDAVIDMLVTNDNVSLSPIEEAGVTARLLRMGLTNKQISAKTGRTLAYLSSLKTINEAPEHIKKMVGEGIIASTMVLQVMNDHKENPEEGFKAIEKAVNDVKASGKVKVKTKDIEKHTNKYNSFRELRAIVKLMKDQDVKNDPEAETLALFAKKLVDNKFSFKALEKLFFDKE
jgi:ParB/RepB/Spo0J family partition protein